MRYANDIIVVAGSIEELQDLMDRVRLEIDKLGLLLNAKKTRVVKIRRTNSKEIDMNIKISNQCIENVKQFVYLGVVFANNYDHCFEVKKRLAIVGNATVALTNTWKDNNISFKVEKRLLNSLVFSVASYGSECLTLKK